MGAIKAVFDVMKDLTLRLVEDGEGARKVVEVRVEGARSLAAAKKVASSIANSQFVKTAFFGEDPNFRQIMAAIATPAFPLTVQRWMFSFNRVTVVKRGVGMPLKEREAARVLCRPSFQVKVRVGQGKQATSIWRADLSHEYVRINSAYRT
jgi:glutamate N-acetyltransferase/amino-acid N-acetyltransferase